MNPSNFQTFLAAIIIGVAIIYEVYLCSFPEGNNTVLDIASIWSKEITKPIKGPTRVVVGVNANLDVIVSAIDLLEALNVSHTLPKDHSSLNSITHLEQLVAFSMLHCAGMERTFADLKLFNNIISIAESLPHKLHIGGNAALIAEKIKSIDSSVQVVLVGPIGDKLKSLLHDGITTPTFASNSSKEEVHVILEYSSAAEWGQIKSSCANRVIFSHDVSNSRMVALDSLHGVVHIFSPDLVVLSGAHLLEGQGQEFWEQRLNDIIDVLETTLRSVPVHWELATVGNLSFCSQLVHSLFTRIESLGLNEQELLSVAKAVDAPFDFDIIPQKPGIEWVSDILHWLMQTFSSISEKPSVLTRIHLHSLSFHVIAAVEGGPWSNNKEAVMAGARIAGLQACDTDVYNSSSFEVTIPEKFIISKTEVSLSSTYSSGWRRWTRGGINYYFSPVLLCRHPTKTVGLGDAISSIGLMYSQFDV